MHVSQKGREGKGREGKGREGTKPGKKGNECSRLACVQKSVRSQSSNVLIWKNVSSATGTLSYPMYVNGNGDATSATRAHTIAR